jgi:hypothetical protein|tara:strand:+ start:508 stop:930 length:423 start_codon:yes stop_codon:yes gene_type:complete
MAGFTNAGKENVLNYAFRAVSTPATYKLCLVTSATAPSADLNTFGQLTEISDSYTEASLTPGTTDFDSTSEDDSNDKGIIQIKDITFAGPITNARYVVLTDANGTKANREVLLFWDLASNRSVSSGQNLVLQDLQIELTE